MQPRLFTLQYLFSQDFQKRSPLLFSLLVVVLFLALIAIPYHYLLEYFFQNEQIIDLLQEMLRRLPVIVLAVFAIKRYNLTALAGMSSAHPFRNAQAYLIPLAFIGLGLSDIVQNREELAAPMVVLLFVLSNISVGFAEEFTFRGLIQSSIIQHFAHKKYGVLLGVVFASVLIFGVLHFVNLLRQPDNFQGIFSQVLFATSIGVFFGALLLRTNKILPVGLLHSLVNIAFGHGEIFPERANPASLSEDHTINMPTLIFFGFIFISGIFMITWTSNEDVIKKINT